MAEKIETVEKDCKHEDCIYRAFIEGCKIPCCMYAAIEGKLRQCKISECDKYAPGKKKKARLDSNIVIFWEYELYGSVSNFDRQRYIEDE